MKKIGSKLWFIITVAYKKGLDSLEEKLIPEKGQGKYEQSRNILLYQKVRKYSKNDENMLKEQHGRQLERVLTG